MALKVLLSSRMRQARLALKSHLSALRGHKAEIYRQVEQVSRSPLFDPVWYLENYPDVCQAGLNPLVHYLEHGASEGRRPGPHFDGQWYLSYYPDVAVAGVNPLIHYLEHGASECRNPGPHFDARWYLEHYPDVAGSGLDPLTHYLLFGLREGRTVRAVGEEEKEEEKRDPINDGSQQDLIRYGELIANSPLFDSAWYLANNLDVAAAGLNPITHYLEHGAAGGRNPGPDFDGDWYLKHYPDVGSKRLNPLIHYLEFGMRENRETRPVSNPRNAEALVQKQFADSMPLATFSIPPGRTRVTIVVDNITDQCHARQVRAGPILAALLAKQLDGDLRLITCLERWSADTFGGILASNGIAWDGDIEFLHSDVNGTRAISVSPKDVFLTTSWQITNSVRAAIDARRIFYVLEDDERTFYPYGDQRVRCEETLMDPSVRTIANSELLYQHLISGENACGNIRSDGTWFEPAFPATNYYGAQTVGLKRQFLFNASPNQRLSLYWRGLEVIISAIERGILASRDWEFNFVGCDLDPIVLPGKAVVKVHNALRTSEYQALIRKMDLALCLIDAPQPGYSPLEAAASGAVVVTNRRGNKTSLSRYSDNIICADAAMTSLLDALQLAVNLVGDASTKSVNYSRSGLLRDWNVALAPTVQRVSELIRFEDHRRCS